MGNSVGGPSNRLMDDKLYDAAMIGASLAYSQYFGDYDHYYNKDYFNLETGNYVQHQESGESVMIGMFEDMSGVDNVSYVIVSFKGMDDMEPSVQLGDFSNCILDFNSIESTLTKIKMSGIWDGPTKVEDYENSNKFCYLNDFLMNNYDAFETSSFNLSEEIITMLELCDSTYKDDPSKNNGKQCELYITGHSKGGVFAVATAAKMRNMLFSHYSDWDYQPYVMTHGMPPPFNSKTPSCNDGVLDDHDKLINFVNILRDVPGYNDWNWVHSEMDVAFLAGLDGNGMHKGTNVIINHKASSIKSWDADDFSYPRPDYGDFVVAQEDLIKLSAHQAELYRDSLRNLATVGGSPMENGFAPGVACFKNIHCDSNDCGSDQICNN